MGCSNVRENVLGPEDKGPKKACVILIGAPESGTATQAKTISQKYNYM